MGRGCDLKTKTALLFVSQSQSIFIFQGAIYIRIMQEGTHHTVCMQLLT